MTTRKALPRLELTEDPNKNNDFIIFRNNFNKRLSKKSFKKTHKQEIKGKNRKTKKHKKRKSIFNIF